jgi:MoxR-like ATPase
VTRPLPRPFLVLATQNPIELEGTFPLPEAQIDRFLMRLALGYPTREEERQIMQRFRDADPITQVGVVASGDDVRRASALCRRVYIHPALEDYMLDLVAASRSHASLMLGVSPRGSLALQRASQAMAALNGRDYVTPDDMKRVAQPILAHRLILNAGTRLRGGTASAVLEDVLKQVAVPVEEVWREQGAAP